MIQTNKNFEVEIDYDNLLVGIEINPIQTENVPIIPEISSQSNVNIPACPPMIIKRTINR